MGQYRAHDVFAAPNLVSLTRAPLAIVFAGTLDHPLIALTVLATAGVSDIVDGWLARRLGRVTPLGIVLDPVTDKLFVLVVVVSLVVGQRLPFPEVLLLAVRELGELPLVLWWIVSRRRRRAKRENPMANWAGKLVTLLQFATVAAALFRSGWVHLLFGATAIAGAIAAALYARRELSALSRP